MKRLTQIADACGTDKGTGFGEGHSYTEIYQDYLDKYIGKRPKILEIGVLTGASVKMFNDFYGGDCEIWTVDIDYSVCSYKADNVHRYTVNQNSLDDWKRFFSEAPEKFDIILDDGSHQPEHQVHTLYWLSDRVEDEGIYILEDLHTYMWDSVEDSPLHLLTFWNQNKYLSQDEQRTLSERIKYYSVVQIMNPRSNYCGRSITSIIHFK